jgi:hypothetical protein
MRQYRWLAAERLERDGVVYWKLTFDLVGGNDGTIRLAMDPLPEPFSAQDKRRLYSEEEVNLLKLRSSS